MRVGPCRWLVLVLVAQLCGCGHPPTPAPQPAAIKTFVILAPQVTPFWEAVKAGMQHAAAAPELASGGYQAVLETGDGTVKAQIAQLQRLADRTDLAGVAISAVEAASESLADEMKKIGAKGIPVITIDSDLDPKKFRDCRQAYVGSDNRKLGTSLAEAATVLSAGGGYLMFTGNPQAQRSIDRIQGFAEGGRDRWKCLRTVEDRFDLVLVRLQVREAVRLFSNKLSVVVALESGPALAAAAAVRELGSRNDLKVLAGDSELKTIDAVAQDMLDAWVLQSPYEMGDSAVALLHALHTKNEPHVQRLLPRWGQPDGDLLYVPFRLVTAAK